MIGGKLYNQLKKLSNALGITYNYTIRKSSGSLLLHHVFRIPNSISGPDKIVIQTAFKRSGFHFNVDGTLRLSDTPFHNERLELLVDRYEWLYVEIDDVIRQGIY